MKRFYYEDAEEPWRPDEILRKYVKAWPQRHGDTEPEGKALDLGMGYGRNALWLAQQGHSVEGWEKDRRYVREARQEARRRGVRLRIRRGDFARAKLRGKYDVVVISQALHQVKRSAALRVLKRAKKALAPGGRLFLLAKLTSDRHIQRVKRDPAWTPVRGEENTWLRPLARRRGNYHPGRPRTPQMILSALTTREIRRALRGLRVRHWRRVVLRSEWEDDRKVTHTVAEVVAERAKVEKRSAKYLEGGAEIG
ncbi:MAG TPA: class I SAM-dependent methyltransferase [Candidatus Xenobia bacterium]|nr:class I SAM-dependent methyltransferase [Candidatus Xenobia bacterium]